MSVWECAAVGCCLFPSTLDMSVGVVGRKGARTSTRAHERARPRTRAHPNARGRPRQISSVVRKVLAEVFGAKG